MNKHTSESLPQIAAGLLSRLKEVRVFIFRFIIWSGGGTFVQHRTSNLQVAGSSPGWTPLRSGLGQATYTCVPLSPSSIIWY